MKIRRHRQCATIFDVSDFVSSLKRFVVVFNLFSGFKKYPSGAPKNNNGSIACIETNIALLWTSTLQSADLELGHPITPHPTFSKLDASSCSVVLLSSFSDYTNKATARCQVPVFFVLRRSVDYRSRPVTEFTEKLYPR